MAAEKRFLWSFDNLLTEDTLVDTSTEDAVYIDDYLYDYRPSRPFYFTAKAAQWVKIDFGAATDVTLCAVFNHNFTDAATIRIQGNAADAWGAPTVNELMTWREFDMYHVFSASQRYWRFYVDDAANPDYPRIGDLWLGEWETFSSARIQPVREDPPKIFAVEQVTPYGQDWDAYLSTSKRFRFSVVNLNDPSNIDDLEAMIENLGGPAGRFVIIPDSREPHVYMVKIVGDPGAIRPIYGDKELREWSFEMKSLTRGITLL